MDIGNKAHDMLVSPAQDAQRFSLSLTQNMPVGKPGFALQKSIASSVSVSSQLLPSSSVALSTVAMSPMSSFVKELSMPQKQQQVARLEYNVNNQMDAFKEYLKFPPDITVKDGVVLLPEGFFSSRESRLHFLPNASELDRLKDELDKTIKAFDEEVLIPDGFDRKQTLALAAPATEDGFEMIHLRNPTTTEEDSFEVISSPHAELIQHDNQIIAQRVTQYERFLDLLSNNIKTYKIEIPEDQWNAFLSGDFIIAPPEVYKNLERGAYD